MYQALSHLLISENDYPPPGGMERPRLSIVSQVVASEGKGSGYFEEEESKGT